MGEPANTQELAVNTTELAVNTTELAVSTKELAVNTKELAVNTKVLDSGGNLVIAIQSLCMCDAMRFRKSIASHEIARHDVLTERCSVLTGV